MRRITDILNSLQNLLRNRAQEQYPLKEEHRCLICCDRGVILEGEEARICPCVKQRYLERRYTYANITPEISSYTFEGFSLDYYKGEHRERAARVLQGARRFVQEYLKNKHIPGLLLTGDVGSGKTYLAGAIANYLLQKGVQVLFLVVPDFLDELRSTYHRGMPGEAVENDDVALLNGARRVEVLVLDDLGVHNYTSWTCNKLYSLLNYRLNYQLPVIITTNLDLSEIEKYLGKRTTSRIVQMCNVYRLTVEDDIRYQKSREKRKNLES
jgi:DNA replication protein DnaC